MLRMNLSISLIIWVKNYSEDNSFSFLMDLEIKKSVISGVINQHCIVWTIMSLKENHSGGRIVIAIKNSRWTKIFLSSLHTNCAKLWLNDVNSWKVQMQYVLLLCQNKTLLSLWILICLGKFKRPPLAFPRFVKLHNYESVHLCKNLHAHFCTVWLNW